MAAKPPEPEGTPLSTLFVEDGFERNYARVERMLHPDDIEFVLARARNGIDETIARKRNASKRRPDRLQDLIIEIITKNLSMKPAELLAELKKHVRGQVVEEITEDEIYFIAKDGKGGNPAQISGLKDRITRAKKYIKSL